MVKKKPQTIVDKYIKQFPWLKSAIHIPEVDMWIIAVDPKQLHENPKNWRVHNQRQRSTYKAFKKKQGWLGLIGFNLRTGKLYDGHMRVDEAIKNKERFVPVLLVDKSEEDENEILGSLDNIGLLAQRNTQALNSLLEASNKAIDSKTVATNEAERKLAQLRKDVQESLGSTENAGTLLPLAKTRIKAKNAADEASDPLDDESDSPSPPGKTRNPPSGYDPDVDAEAFVTEVNESALFPGLTEMGIPELRVDRLATPDQVPTQVFTGDNFSEHTYHCYSQTFVEDAVVGCIGFYVEDDKFDGAYSSPAGFIEFLNTVSPNVLIGPDFSSYPGAWPLAMNLWNVYRSRWVTRMWQEAGFNVIPTIQVLDLPADGYYLTSKYILDTLPHETPVVSLECRKMDPDPESVKSILIPLCRLICDIINPQTILLYGGQEKQKYLHGYMPTKHKKGRGKTNYVYLPQIYNEKKKRRRKSV